MDPLYRLLRALVALGVLEEGGDGVFGLTGVGRGASDTHLSLRDWAEWEGRDRLSATWRKLRDSVRTGRRPSTWSRALTSGPGFPPGRTRRRCFA